MPITYDPNGRRPIGRAQGTDGDYPLVAPSADVAYLLADLYLHTPDAGYVLPLRVDWLYGFGSDPPTGSMPSSPVNPAECRIVDADGTEVFNTAELGDVTHVQQGLAGRLRVDEWDSPTAGYLRVTSHTAWQTGSASPAPHEYPSSFRPAAAVIQADAFELTPDTFRGVYLAGESPNDAAEVVFAAGDGVAASGTPPAAGSPVGTDSVVTLAASGRASAGCDGTGPNYLTDIGGAKADTAGGVRLAAKTDCHSVHVPAAFVGGGWVVTENALALRNDCTPCPTCDGFVAVKRAIDKAYWELTNTASLLTALKASYADANARWVARTNPVAPTGLPDEADVPPLLASLAASTGCGNVLSVKFVCRASRAPVADVSVAFTWSGAGIGPLGTLQYVKGGIQRNFPPSVSKMINVPVTTGPTSFPDTQDYDLVTAAVPARFDAVLRTQYRCGVALDIAATLTATITAPSLGSPIVVTADVTFPGPCNDDLCL